MSQLPINPPSADKNRWLYRAGLAVILAALVVIKLPYLKADSLWPDEALYLWAARTVYENPAKLLSPEVVSHHPPLFSIIVALGQIILPTEAAARVIMLVSNLLAIVLMFRLGTLVQSRFAGFVSALLLAFNYFVYANAARVLIDPLLMVFFLWFIITVKEAGEDRHVKVGLIAVLILAMKWAGVLVIPLLVLGYTFGMPQISRKERWQKGRTPLLMSLAALGLLLIMNVSANRTAAPNLASFTGTFYDLPFWHYWAYLPVTLGTGWYAGLAVTGLYSLIRERHRDRGLILSWFLLMAVAVSVIPEKPFHYFLLVVPSLTLAAGIATDVIISKLPRAGWQAVCRILLLGLITLHAIIRLPQSSRAMTRVFQSYTGFREAGDWLIRQTPEEAVIVSASARTLRYYTGRNLREYGGPIVQLPPGADDLWELVRQSPAPVYLVLDRWELSLPDWLTPPPDKGAEALTRMGFRPSQIIYQTFHDPQTGDEKSRPAIWIFRAPPRG